jgi:hypothetical protein
MTQRSCYIYSISSHIPKIFVKFDLELTCAGTHHSHLTDSNHCVGVILKLIELNKLPGNQAHEKVAVAKLATAQAIQQCPDLLSSASNLQLLILHHCHKIKKTEFHKLNATQGRKI